MFKIGKTGFKKVCAVILAAAITSLAFGACNSTSASSSSSTTSAEVVGVYTGAPLYGEGSDGTINLKVWGPEAAQDILRIQCDEFIENMKPYADIEIDIVPQGEADPAAQILVDATTAADVFGFACDSIDKLVTAGTLLEVVGADKDFVISQNSEGSVSAATVDGKLYAYPETGDNSYCLFYDKSIVSEEQTKTLEGVLKACREKNVKFVMDAKDGFYSCIFLFTGGLTTDGYEEDGIKQKFSDYNEKQVVKTILAFRDLFSEYQDVFLNGEVTKVVDGFKSGTVGAGIDGSWNFSYAKETLGDNAGFAVLPTIDVDGKPTQIINMFGYKLIGVNSNTKYPNTSIELAKYLTSEECQLQRAEELNWGPSNINVAESDLIRNDEALSAILAQSEYSIPQVGISQLFWQPVGTLGNRLVDFDNPLDEESCTELLKTTIANVRDE